MLPSGLAAGTYTGSITISANNPDGFPVSDSPFVIPVTLVVTSGTLTVTPASLAFTQVVGGAAPATQTLSVGNSGTGTLNFTAVATTTSGVSWLSVSPTAGIAPATLTVTANGTNLSAGTYMGSITVTAPGAAASPQIIPVTLTVTALPNITVTPTTLTFTVPMGSPAPAAQNVMVTSTGPDFMFTAAAATSNNSGNWLSVTPASGMTPATLSVSVNSAGLATGTYMGTVTVTAAGTGNSPQTVMVTLTVTAPVLPLITLTSSSLTFSFQKGGTTPAAQTVMLTSSGADFMFTAAAATSNNSGNWLTVSPTSGTTPATLSVTVDPSSLDPGTYMGTVTITAAGTANSPQTINVTLAITAAGTPTVTAVQNAASQLLGAIAPGEIISIYGSNLGPATGTLGAVTNGMLSTTVSDVQVLFDNIAAPLLYVSAVQINAVVPFELLGRFQTMMTVTHAGSVSGAINLNVANTAPGIFTVSENGSGPGAILNSDYSLNTSTNPAKQGSYIMVYGTGGGQTTPPGITGKINPIDGSDLKTISGVTAKIGGVAATVLYAGTAPGFVEGGLQVDVQLPASLPSGPQPVTITIGGVTSQTGVTVEIQ